MTLGLSGGTAMRSGDADGLLVAGRVAGIRPSAAYSIVAENSDVVRSSRRHFIELPMLHMPSIVT
jgi:hypothetical protein